MKLPAVAAYKAEPIRVVPTAVLGESKCREPERGPKYKDISCPVISSQHVYVWVLLILWLLT